MCNRKHNSLLHIPKPVTNSEVDKTDSERGVVVGSAYCNKEKQRKVLLATAMVLVVDQNKKCHQLRAMLDSGSQINILSAVAAKRVNLLTTQSNLRIKGIENANTKANSRTTLEVQSAYSSCS